MAVAVFIASLPSLVQRKPFSFFILIFVAANFHYSAALLFFIYPLYWSGVWKNYLVPLIFVSLIVKLSLGEMLSLFVWVAGKVDLGFALTLKIQQYSIASESSFGSLGIGFWERLLSLLLIYYYKDKLVEQFGVRGRVTIFLCVCNFLLSLFFWDFSEFYLRVRYYFLFATFALYAQLLTLFQPRAVLWVGLLLYGFLWVYLVLSANEELYLPYRNYLV